MTGPNIHLDPDDLWAHAHRSKNRAVDYTTPYPPDVAQDGWPSQRAVADGHRSMAQAGQAFSDRQVDRGNGVAAAGDGFSGQDFDAAKIMQAVGALVGPGVQGVMAALQAATQLGGQMVTAGASSLTQILSAATGLMGNLVGKVTPAGAAVGGEAGAAGGGASSSAAGGSAAPLGGISHSDPPRDSRPDGQKGTTVNVALPNFGSGGIGGMPMGRSVEGGRHTKTETVRVVSDDNTDTAPIPIPVFAQAVIQKEET